MSVSPQKRVVRLDEKSFEQLRQYATQLSVSMDEAACAFVKAGVASREFAERVEEMLEKDPSGY